MSFTLANATGFVPAAPLTGAAGLARQFEREITQQGWRCGAVFGPEKQLAEEHDTSPYLVRQALRILEGRNLGRVRRGSPGGLVLQLPTERTTAHAMALYLMSRGVTADQLATARAIVDEISSAQVPQIIEATLAELDQCFAAESEARPDDAAPKHAPNRAIGIARRIVRDARGAGAEGAPLGTIEDLCERYFAGRPVITQAVRVLEDLEIVTSVRGRSETAYPPGGVVFTLDAPLDALRDGEDAV